jgi:hypothetical protein
MPAAAYRRAAPFLLALQVTAAAGCSGGPASGRATADTAGGSVAPSPAADAVVIEWRPRAAAAPATVAAPALAAPPSPATDAGERVSIGRGGLWIGPADGRGSLYLFARRQRGDELALFAGTYAPFRRSDGAGDLIFRGRGVAAAAAAEQRMIGEWTRLVAVEAGGDGGQLPYGLAFAWHRGAAIGGICDDLSVYLSGEVQASSCGGGGIGGRLTGERLERLYGWVDGLQSFQAAGEQGLRADSLLERLIFAGRGKRQASAQEVAAIEALAGALHHELVTAGAAPGGARAGAPPIAAAATAPVRTPPTAPRKRTPVAAPVPESRMPEEADDAPEPPPGPPPPPEPGPPR